MHGRNGEDLYLKVPVGTLVRDAKSKEILYDLDESGKELLLVR